MKPSPSLSWRSAHSGSGPPGVASGVGGGGGGVGAGVGGGGGGVALGVGGGCVVGADGLATDVGFGVAPGDAFATGPLVDWTEGSGVCPGSGGPMAGDGAAEVSGPPVGSAPGDPGTGDPMAPATADGCGLPTPPWTAWVGEDSEFAPSSPSAGARKKRQPMKAKAMKAAREAPAIAARRVTISQANRPGVAAASGRPAMPRSTDASSSMAATIRWHSGQLAACTASSRGGSPDGAATSQLLKRAWR